MIGPYKYNGVPLKRVNGAYVLTTNTKLKLDAKVADSIKDDFFKKNWIKYKRRKRFFCWRKAKKERVTEERKKGQTTVDTEVKKVVDTIPMTKEYLRNRFALKSGDKPHLMK